MQLLVFLCAEILSILALSQRTGLTSIAECSAVSNCRQDVLRWPFFLVHHQRLAQIPRKVRVDARATLMS